LIVLDDLQSAPHQQQIFRIAQKRLMVEPQAATAADTSTAFVLGGALLVIAAILAFWGLLNTLASRYTRDNDEPGVTRRRMPPPTPSTLDF
jgi:hypothetical protein